MRRKTAIILTACVLASTPAFAASPASQAPLAPGSAAGLQKAEMTQPSTAVWVGGGAIVAVGLVLALSGSGNGHGPSSTSTTTTSATATH